jgi:hypothetical protein
MRQGILVAGEVVPGTFCKKEIDIRRLLFDHLSDPRPIRVGREVLSADRDQRRDMEICVSRGLRRPIASSQRL